MKDLDALAPLRIDVFRMLWMTWLTANVCMWMNEVAAAWMMTTLTESAAMVALVQTAATLPVFLLGLPSGALADILDRRIWFMFTQLWIAAISLVIALVVISGAMSAPLLLALTFANGIGMAMRWPVFSAIVPELVPRVQLPAALGLNGIAMNTSRIVGPIAAGALIAGAGSAYVFALTALLSIFASVVIWRWKREPTKSALPGERFIGAMRVGVQYVRQSPRMRAILVRIALFFFHSTALMSLLPLVAQRLRGGGAGTFTLLLAAMGFGAIFASLVMPRLRAAMPRHKLVLSGSLVQAAATVAVALAPNVPVAMLAMIIAGAAWITAANSLAVSAQLALPDWVRARGMSIYQMALMGGAATGAAIWGQVATLTSVRTSLLIAAVSGVIASILAARLQIDGPADEDLTPVPWWQPPVTAIPLAPTAGPVLVTIEYLIDPARAADFEELMEETRRVRLRYGTLSWELFRDIMDPRRYVEYYIDESWVEHQRHFERYAPADVALRDRRRAFHVGDELPKVSRFIASHLRADHRNS